MATVPVYRRLTAATVMVMLGLAACGSPVEDARSDQQSTQTSPAQAAEGGDGDGSAGDQPSGLKRECATVTYPQTEPETTAKKLIEAVQRGDQTAVCANIGRAEVPDGLLRYADALQQGLAPDVKLLERMEQPEVDALRFQAGGEDSRAILGVAFQKRERGWTVLTATFLD